MVTNLLYIRFIVNTNSAITHAVFHHTCLLNTMVDDASRCFGLLPPPPCIFIFCKYHPQQFPSSKIGCYLSNSVLSSTISTMHGHQSEAVTFPTLKWLSYTCNGSPSAPTCISTTCFSTMESLPLKPFRCTHTGFIMGTTPNNLVPGRTQLQRCGALLLRPTYWRASWTPQNPLAPLLKTLISGCCTWH